LRIGNYQSSACHFYCKFACPLLIFCCLPLAGTGGWWLSAHPCRLPTRTTHSLLPYQATRRSSSGSRRTPGSRQAVAPSVSTRGVAACRCGSVAIWRRRALGGCKVENRKAGGQRLAARRSDRPTPTAWVTTGEAAMRHPDKQKRESRSRQDRHRTLWLERLSFLLSLYWARILRDLAQYPEPGQKTAYTIRGILGHA
jgi:hypothetical protein